MSLELDICCGTLLLGLIPPIAIALLLRRKRPAKACPNCDYDRAGLDDSKRCPECGSLPEQPDPTDTQHGHASPSPGTPATRWERGRAQPTHGRGAGRAARPM